MMKRTTSHEVGVKSGALGPSHSEQVLPTSAQEGLAACWLPARPEEETDFLLEGWRAPVQPSPLPPPPERPSHLLLAHRPTCITPRCPATSAPTADSSYTHSPQPTGPRCGHQLCYLAVESPLL